MESDNTTSPEDWDDLLQTTREPLLMEDQRGGARGRGVIQGHVPITSARLTPYELAVRAQSRALSRVERRVPAEAIGTCEFPFWYEWERAIPNHIARSSIFAPIARQKRRKMMRNEVVTSRSDAMILFSGEQLDESDCDVWLEILHLARRSPRKERVEFVRSQFLQSIGRTTSGPMYLWLEEAINRLTLAMIQIETSKYSIGRTLGSSALHLTDSYDLCRASGHYRVTVDRRLVTLFGGNEFTRINWSKRLQICKHRNMAKFLQRLICTSSDRKQRYPLAHLKNVTHYNSQDSKFEESILGALQELKRVGIIESFHTEKNLAGAKYVLWIR